MDLGWWFYGNLGSQVREVVYFISIKLYRTGAAAGILFLCLLAVRFSIKKAGEKNGARNRMAGLVPYLVRQLWWFLPLALLCTRIKIFSGWREPLSLLLERLSLLLGMDPFTEVMAQAAIGILYISITLIMGVITIARRLTMNRIIKKLPVYPDQDGSLSRITERTGRRVRRLTCRVSHSSAPPFSYGLFRPCIVLPKDYQSRYCGRELDMIFLHEIAHIRHRDLWYLAFLQAAECLWWANPFVWLCNSLIREDMEAACDAYVLDEGMSRKDYGLAILKSLSCVDAAAVEKKCAASLPIDGGSLAVRFAFISSHRSGEKILVLRTAIAVCCLAVLFGIGIKAVSHPAYKELNLVDGVSAADGAQILDKGQCSPYVRVVDNRLKIDGEGLTARLAEQGWQGDRIRIDLVLYSKEEYYVIHGCVTMDESDLWHTGEMDIPLSENWDEQLNYVFFKYLL